MKPLFLCQYKRNKNAMDKKVWIDNAREHLHLLYYFISSEKYMPVKSGFHAGVMKISPA